MAIVICVLQRSIAYRPVRPCKLKYAGEQPGAVTVNTVVMISNFPSGLRHPGGRAQPAAANVGKRRVLVSKLTGCRETVAFVAV
jgi:hypothetical protein